MLRCWLLNLDREFLSRTADSFGENGEDFLSTPLERRFVELADFPVNRFLASQVFRQVDAGNQRTEFRTRHWIDPHVAAEIADVYRQRFL